MSGTKEVTGSHSADHPQMLLTVLLYGYCTGVCSSRKIARSCEMDLAFRVLSGGQFPDFRTQAYCSEGAIWRPSNACSWRCGKLMPT